MHDTLYTYMPKHGYWILTLNFEINDHLLKVVDILIDLRSFAFIGTSVGLRYVSNDKSLGRDLIFSVIVSLTDYCTPYIPRDRRFGISSHFAYQCESATPIFHGLYLVSALK